MPSSPDTLRTILTRFATIAWSSTVDSCNPNEISWTIINCAPTFRTANIFAFLFGQDRLVKHKLSNKSTLHIHLCGFQITHWKKQSTTCQRINYHQTTNQLRCEVTMAWTASVIWRTRCKLSRMKILLNFWLTQTEYAELSRLKKNCMDIGKYFELKFVII